MRFKTKALAIASAVAFVAAGANAHAAILGPSLLPQAPTAAHRLVFDDEFSSPKIGWDTCYPWWPTSSRGCTNEGNPDEQEWYMPSGVVPAGGSALLTARRQLTTGTYRGTPKVFDYVSGMIQSRRTFSFQYGYVEVRMKLAPGQAMWDAAWMLPVRWDHRGEIDIFEGYGQAPNALALTYHTPTGGRFRKDIPSGLPDLTAGFHTYGLDWEPTKLTWYLDGKPLFVVNQPTPAEPMYLLANLAVAGRFLTPTSPATSTAAVDYVRVWQR